ncbi:MAG: hypothetical protein IJS45_06825 [Clostridia bacterium]|nr:hypothetical protein [Clostridia bacterium]
MCNHKLSEKEILLESFRMIFHNQVKNRQCKNCARRIELSEKGIKIKNRIDSIVVSVLLCLTGVMIYVFRSEVRNSPVTFLIVFSLFFFTTAIIRFISFYIAFHYFEFKER